MMRSDLFAPRSVAVVGASPAAHAVTSRPLQFLKRHGFAGNVDAVNPRYERIGDVACYPSVRAIPQRPDVAMVAVPAHALESAVGDCADLGVPLVCIFTSGVDDSMRARIAVRAASGGSRILGPNSLGFIDAHARVACTYSQAALVRRIPAGALSIVSQSGGLGGCLLNRAVDKGIGIARFLTPGAGLDLGVAELLEDLASSPETRVVAAIIESVPDGPRFLGAVERLHAAGKRLVVWRIGVSPAGRTVAVSHTGALASDERVFAAVCRDLGVVQVGSIDELLEVAAGSATLQQPAGRSVGIVTSSGGAAIIVADALEAAGLSLPALSIETADKLRAVLPPTGTIANPLDLGAGQGAEVFRAGLDAVLRDSAFDSVVLALTMVAGEQAKQAIPTIIRASRVATRPLVVIWPAGSLATTWRRRLRREGLTVFENAAHAATALRMPRQKSSRSFASGVDPTCLEGLAALELQGAGGVRTEWRTRRMLAHYGIESPAELLATTAEQARLAARAIGFPVALKLQSPMMPHRRKAGGIRLDVADEAGVDAAYHELRAALGSSREGSFEGVLVQEMVTPEHEVILGMLRDPTFGAVVACGIGGSAVEDRGHVDFFLPSDERADFISQLSELPVGLAVGTMGIETIAELLVRVSRLIADLGARLSELDINPVALVEGGRRALALDALAVIAEDQAHAQAKSLESCTAGEAQ
jgi:acyl-CoA synthetase (NDP forming)